MADIIAFPQAAQPVKNGLKGAACYTTGTMIATARGERRIEDLQVGDRVITRDSGLQQIRRVTTQTIQQADVEVMMIRIPTGALGAGLPERDMLVSGDQMILVRNDTAQSFYDAAEHFVPARDLVGENGILPVKAPETTLVHIAFSETEVILSDGCWSESAPLATKAYQNFYAQQTPRQDITPLFPEHRNPESVEEVASAKRVVRRHVAKIFG